MREVACEAEGSGKRDSKCMALSNEHDGDTTCMWQSRYTLTQGGTYVHIYTLSKATDVYHPLGTDEGPLSFPTSPPRRLLIWMLTLCQLSGYVALDRRMRDRMVVGGVRAE